MDVLLWFIIIVAGLLAAWVILSIIWATVMIWKVATGHFGDLNDLGGDDGGVQAEP